MGFFRVNRSFFCREGKMQKKKSRWKYTFSKGEMQKKKRPYRERGNSGGGGTVVLFPKPNRR